MRLACKVDGRPALIVGYTPGKKGKIHAVVITNGVMRAVRLKHIELVNPPEPLDAPNVGPRTMLKAVGDE